MTTLDARKVVTGRREPSDSRLPLVVQRQQRESAAKDIAERASRVFSTTLARELDKLNRVKA